MYGLYGIKDSKILEPRGIANNKQPMQPYFMTLENFNKKIYFDNEREMPNLGLAKNIGLL